MNNLIVVTKYGAELLFEDVVHEVKSSILTIRGTPSNPRGETTIATFGRGRWQHVLPEETWNNRKKLKPSKPKLCDRENYTIIPDKWFDLNLPVMAKMILVTIKMLGVHKRPKKAVNASYSTLRRITGIGSDHTLVKWVKWLDQIGILRIKDHEDQSFKYWIKDFSVDTVNDRINKLEDPGNTPLVLTDTPNKEGIAAVLVSGDTKTTEVDGMKVVESGAKPRPLYTAKKKGTEIAS